MTAPPRPAPSREHAAAWSDTYEMVVGLEVHVQLATRTKAFCNCATTFGAAPNAQTCPVCLGLPGTLPVLSYEAVRLAVRVALALGCDVNEISVFARKNYFYPDLPKGYQITQHDRPLATGGHVPIGETDEGGVISAAVTRVHLEEDAGRSLHDRFDGESAIDFNRCGVPLVEIVGEPELRSAAEAGAYLRSLKQIMQYVDASDASMEEGSLRVDANISARPHGDTALGTKTEIKNLNSFSAVERALDAEFARQCTILASGGTVERQTMLWDAARGECRPTRSKEESDDYRYFPDPDLPPLILTREWIDERCAELPELPVAHRARLRELYALSVPELAVLTSSRSLADYFERVARAHGDAKAAARWVMRDVLAVLNETGRSIEEFELQVRPADLATLLDMIRDGHVSHSAGAQIFVQMVRTGDEPRAIVERDGLTRVTDDAQLRTWVDEVLAERPDIAKRFVAGDHKLQGPLVGWVIKKSGGSADPARVAALLDERASTTR